MRCQRIKLPQGLKTKKIHMTSSKVIELGRMSSVDLGKVTMSVKIMDLTSQHPLMCILRVKMPKFASYRRQNATER